MKQQLKIQVKVDASWLESSHVKAVRFSAVTGEQLPSFEPGAHVDVHLPEGLVRSYSLLSPPEDLSHYTIGVLRDRNSRGGSIFVHENFAPGVEFEISPPRNNFRLEEQAKQSVFVAGGIGITPMIQMARRMRGKGRSVRIVYACRSKADAAFLADVHAIDPDAILHFDDEAGAPLDFRKHLAHHPKDAHFYCCGPAPMLDAFIAAGPELGFSNLHVERFAAPVAKQIVAEGAHEFKVRLARAGEIFSISEDATILQTLLEAGFDLPYNCEAGICGTCETTVIDGVPEHRDAFLTEAERRKNDRMMICVSRCRGGSLTLDI